MKKIIFALAFIYCTFCEGPAYNVEEREEGHCMAAENAKFDEVVDNPNLSLSSCVDRDLYGGKSRYFDKCCYMRYRKDGFMRHGCIGLNREQVMDIPETIHNLEKGERNHFLNDEFKNSKIYELNCNFSYLKLFALSFALISLLF